MSPFADVASILPQQVWEGILARPIHGEQLTLAIVELDPGAVVGEHSHDHEQLGIVLRGSLRFRVGEGERELGPGGTWSISSDVPHSATAGPDGASVIDVFAPAQHDWQEIERQEPRPGRWP